MRTVEFRFNDHRGTPLCDDTAHGFAHRDELHPAGEPTKTELEFQGYSNALTFVIQDLKENWERYRRRYGRWLDQG